MAKRFGASPIRDREKTEDKSDGYYMDNPCDEVFTCVVCGRTVHPEGASSDHRNHCPECLSSVHLDNIPGDRASDCHGVMEPIAVWVRDGGEWAIIHRCKKCGHLSSNRSAADDNPVRLVAIARKPMENPPFPLDRLDDIARSLGY